MHFSVDLPQEIGEEVRETAHASYMTMERFVEIAIRDRLNLYRQWRQPELNGSLQAGWVRELVAQTPRRPATMFPPAVSDDEETMVETLAKFHAMNREPSEEESGDEYECLR